LSELFEFSESLPEWARVAIAIAAVVLAVFLGVVKALGTPTPGNTQIMRNSPLAKQAGRDISVGTTPPRDKE